MLLVRQEDEHPACKKHEWWGAGAIICLERGADLDMAQLMPLTLTVSCFSKSRLVLLFWYRPFVQVVPDKKAIKWVCVYVYACVCDKNRKLSPVAR